MPDEYAFSCELTMFYSDESDDRPDFQNDLDSWSSYDYMYIKMAATKN